MISKDYPVPHSSIMPAPLSSLTGLALIGAALLWSGCATPSSQAGTQSEATGTSESGGSETSGSPSSASPGADAPLPSFRPDAGAADITSMTWASGGTLRLGYADGKWAKLDVQAQDATLHLASKTGEPVVALSPRAELALMGSTPPTVIRLRDHQVVLRLNKVKQMNAGGFFMSGAGFFAAEKSGALHIWKKSEKTLDKASTRDLKRVAMRQSADFSVGLPATRGQWLVTPDNSLVMGTAEGEILSWSLNAPEDLNTVGRLPSPGRSFGLTEDYFVAATADGALRVSKRARRAFLPWSTEARAEVVAASDKLGASFAVLEKSGDRFLIGLRDFKSGDYRWKANIERAELCGFELSQDARKLAICAGSGVLILDTANGQPIGAFRRNGESLEWQ